MGFVPPGGTVALTESLPILGDKLPFDNRMENGLL